jgi:hypothetical protein
MTSNKLGGCTSFPWIYKAKIRRKIKTFNANKLCHYSSHINHVINFNETSISIMPFEPKPTLYFSTTSNYNSLSMGTQEGRTTLALLKLGS